MYHLYLFIIFALHSFSVFFLKLISFHPSETETGRWNSAPQDRCHQARKGQHHQDLNKLDNGRLESHDITMECKVCRFVGCYIRGLCRFRNLRKIHLHWCIRLRIVTSYNIIQHQSLSTVCLTLIRSLPPFSRSPTRQLFLQQSPASSCWPLNLAIQIYPWRSNQDRDMCVQFYMDYTCDHVSHTLEPRLSHVPTWPDHQPSAQRPGRPKSTVPKIWLKKTDLFDWAIRPGPMTSAEYARTHPRVLHKNRSSNTRPVSSVRCTPCVRHSVQHCNFSNDVTLLRDLNFKQFELGTEAVEQAAPGTHCLNRTELWSQVSFTKQNCVHLFLKCFFVKEWLWFPFALRW